MENKIRRNASKEQTDEAIRQFYSYCMDFYRKTHMSESFEEKVIRTVLPLNNWKVLAMSGFTAFKDYGDKRLSRLLFEKSANILMKEGWIAPEQDTFQFGMLMTEYLSNTTIEGESGCCHIALAKKLHVYIHESIDEFVQNRGEFSPYHTLQLDPEFGYRILEDIAISCFGDEKLGQVLSDKADRMM